MAPKKKERKARVNKKVMRQIAEAVKEDRARKKESRKQLRKNADDEVSFQCPQINFDIEQIAFRIKRTFGGKILNLQKRTFQSLKRLEAVLEIKQAGIKKKLFLSDEQLFKMQREAKKIIANQKV